MTNYVIPFDQLRMSDIDKVGGKNASLGEMISQLSSSGVRVPGGFATTALAFREFLAFQGLSGRINAALLALDVDDVVALARCGAQIRQWVVDTPFPPALESEIRQHYEMLVAGGIGVTPILGMARRPKTCPMRRLPDSRKVFSTSTATKIFCAPSRKFSSRSITTGRSLTACTRVSPMPTSLCRPVCSAWCVPTVVSLA